MADYDAESLADQMIRIGLVSTSQMREIREEAADWTVDGMTRMLMRKGWLTSWQRDKLIKGDFSGYFYGQAKVLFHIAEGTFARVYRGQRDTGEAVAIKVLRRRFTTDPAAVARFAQEAEAGINLVHPNIVKIHEFGESDKLHYMIMEYVEGSNLRDFLKIRGKLEAVEALPILLGLARGLKYSHEKTVTHRDIKGTNILISTRRESKLVDFGLANVGDDRVSEFAHTRTVDYSALERTCGSPKGDPRSDIYFLGCVFYQMLTGVLPLPEVETADPLAKMLKRSFGAIKPVGELRYPPPAELCQIIDRMMHIKLESRYQSMGDVLRDLDAYERQCTGKSTSVQEESVLDLSASDELLFTEAFGRQRGAMESASVKAPVSPAPSSGTLPVKPVEEANRPSPPANPVRVSVASASDSSKKNLLLVESQVGVQEALTKALTKFGFEVTAFGDAHSALAHFSEMQPGVVLFDLDGLRGGGLEAFLDIHQKAHDDHFELASVVILGPKQEEVSDELPLDDRLSILHKPVKIKDVQNALQQLGLLS